jgi:Fibronectin type III domain
MRLQRVTVVVCAGALLAAMPWTSVAAEPGFAPVKLMPSIIGVPHSVELAYASVSCPTAETCTAVGPGFIISGPFTSVATPTAITERGGQWERRVPLPLPSDAVASTSTSASVSSLSCTTAQGCVGVGSYPVSGGGSAALIETGSTGRWRASTIASPGGATGNSEFSSVWCHVSSCIAFGSYQPPGQQNLPMVDVEVSGKWAAATGLMAPAHGFQPTSIGCAGIGSCIAAGFGGDRTVSTVVWRLHDGVWGQPHELSNPKGWQFLAISAACATKSTCFLGGGFVQLSSGGSGAMLPSVRSLRNGVWSAPRQLPTPRLSPRLGQGLVTSLACPSPTTCVAVGGFLSDPTNARARPGAYTWTNDQWSSAGMIRGVPLGGTIAYQSYFTAVGCASARQCVGIGPVRQGEGKHSSASSFFALITPTREISVPSRPTAVAVTPVSRGALITWAPPISDGGLPVVGYAVTVEPGDVHCVPRGTTCHVTGLFAGKTYVVSVDAQNAAGHSAPTVPRRFEPLR